VERRLITGLAAALAALAVAAPSADAAPDPLRGQQWGLDMIQADQAHATTTGQGAVVAVIDTGVDASHADLQGRLVPGWDFVDKDNTPQDGNEHGTHVTGIIAANANNGIGVDSVAPGSKVMPIRVLDNNGEGNDADVAAGIDWAVAHHADVINLSLGGTALEAIMPSAAFQDSIQKAVNAWIVVVAAAGNDSLPICEQPSIQGSILCVGAVDRRGLRSFFSSGDDASVMAPGGSALPGDDEDILSTVPGSQYAYIAGTSQATPHVAGVAALLVSLGLRGRAVTDRLLATATDLGAPGADPEYGHGLVNARAAVAGVRMRPGAPAAALQPFVRVRRHQRAARAVRVRMRSAADGRARIIVRSGGRTVARAVRRLRAGRARSVTARLVPRARRAAPLRARVRVRLPGEHRVRIRRVRVRR
jgi:subtilisin family serine protease